MTTQLIKNTITRGNNLLARIPQDISLLALRLGLAGVFWASARTKVTEGLTISDSTYYLFEEEYQLPFISSDLAVPLATYAEHLLPILLLLGLATRVSALGLFIMSLVIQLFVYPAAFMSTHLGWFAMAIAVMGFGPGRLSIDHIISKANKDGQATA